MRSSLLIYTYSTGNNVNESYRGTDGVMKKLCVSNQGSAVTQIRVDEVNHQICPSGLSRLV